MKTDAGEILPSHKPKSTRETELLISGNLSTYIYNLSALIELLSLILIDHSIVIHKRPDHQTQPLLPFSRNKKNKPTSHILKPHNLPKRTFLFKFAYGAICIILVLIECSSTPLAFPRPSPVNSAAFMMPRVPIMENQWCIISFVTVIFSGYTDARTSLHGCKKSTCHTIDEPHGYPIKLSTPG